MKSVVSDLNSKRSSLRRQVLVIACLSIALAVVGSLALCSCAHTPEGLTREEGLYLSVSNGLVSARNLTPYIPPPVSTVYEGFLAVAGAALAVWASHLHRSIGELKKNGNDGANGPAPPAGPGPPLPSA